MLPRTGIAPFDFTAPDLDDDYRVKGLTIKRRQLFCRPCPRPRQTLSQNRPPPLLLGTSLVGLAGLGMLPERRQRSRHA